MTLSTAVRQILLNSAAFDIKQVSPDFSIDAARSVITLNGSTVAQINGLYNPLNASQTTAASQPIYLPTGFNGFPCLSFDGIDDQLNFFLPQAFNQEIFAVVDTTQMLGSDRVLLDRDGTVSAPFQPALYLGSASYAPNIYWGSNYKVVSVPTQRKYIVRYKIGSLCEVQIDGGITYTGVNNETVLSNWNAIGNSSVQQAKILLKEIHIIRGENLTNDLRDKIHADLAQRSGLAALLPDTNPYKNRRIPR